MKKIILLIAFFATFSFSFGQGMHRRHITNESICVMVHKSAVLSGLKNPNLIYPGYYLLWEYPDGYSKLIKIKKGDCMWKKSKNLLEDYIPQEFPIDNSYTNYYEPVKRNYLRGVKQTENPIIVIWNTFSVWAWVVFAFILAILSILASKNDKNEKEKEKKNKRIDIK